jgi:F420-dependent oxidoreductase-like protein
MKVAISSDPFGIENWQAFADYVVEAERLGVDSLWAAETWAYDAATPLAYLAARTTRIGLGTGVMQLGARSPAMIAMTATALAAMSGGRFLLGLGVSGPHVVEGWHGVPFARPLQRTRETVAIVRQALRGERLTSEGEIYRLPLPGGEGKALTLGTRPPGDIPLYLATLGPQNLELTGEVADGWLGTSFIPEHADTFFSHIAAGAARAGRTLADLDLHVAAGVVAFAADERDLARLVAARKPGLAFTLGAMGSREHNFYNAAWQRAGYADLAREVQRLWLEHRRDEAIARIPDDAILLSNLLGDEAMIRERLCRHRDAGVTTLRVAPDGATPEARLATLAHLLTIIREVDAEVGAA